MQSFVDLKELVGRNQRGLRLSLLSSVLTLLVISILPGCTQAQDTKAEKNQTISALYRSSGAADTANSLSKAIVAEMQQRLGQETANAQNQGVVDRFNKLVGQIDFAKDAEQMVNASLEQALSEDEAKFLSKFYDSPTGKKSVEVNPELAKAGKTAMQTQVVPFLKKLRAEAAGGPPAGEFQPSDLKSQLDAIPPEKKELIGRMIKFTHPADSVREGIAGFEQSQKVRINADPSIPPQEKAKLISISDKYVALLNTRVNWSAALEPIFSIEFNRLFSRDDLQNLVSFYETPSQEAISKKMATALNQGFETLQKLWVEKISRVAEQAKAGT